MCKEKLESRVLIRPACDCITTLNYSLKDGMLTVPSFLLVIARVLFPPETGHFWANLKMRKYFENYASRGVYLSCDRWGFHCLQVDEDDAHAFGRNSFWHIDWNNSFLAMQLSVNLLSWSSKVMTFKI